MPYPTLIQALLDPAIYPHPVKEIELFETHISWVILTGEFAYKIKKPVDLGFLDFSTLEKRQFYCQQELTLNQRLAPEIYLELIAIGGTAEAPLLGTSNNAFEYAIKMRQFDPSQQLDRLSAQNRVTPTHIDQLADSIAEFHAHCETATDKQAFGEPAAIWHPVQENFDQIHALLEQGHNDPQLERLADWSKTTFEQLETLIRQRKQSGFVRNGHGDMHLANMTLIDDKVVLFDCIEFNDEFRWIDVISDIAFTVMDLIDRKQSALAYRLLDRYLQRSGDYQGLALLRFYLVYRAMVRAKVAIIRSHQAGVSDSARQDCLAEYRQYQQLAEDFTHAASPILFIAHGVSGSGKTVMTQPLLERFGMIRLRSDVERKRLFGLSPEARSDSDTQAGIYNADASQLTYQKLAELAQTVIEAGYSCIVDATFLKRSQRQQFQQLAARLERRFVILHFHADKALLCQWIEERLAAGKDASEATVEVLEHQLRSEEPLDNKEADQIIAIDTGFDEATDELIRAVTPLYD